MLEESGEGQWMRTEGLDVYQITLDSFLAWLPSLTMETQSQWLFSSQFSYAEIEKKTNKQKAGEGRRERQGGDWFFLIRWNPRNIINRDGKEGHTWLSFCLPKAVIANQSMFIYSSAKLRNELTIFLNKLPPGSHSHWSDLKVRIKPSWHNTSQLTLSHVHFLECFLLRTHLMAELNVLYKPFFWGNCLSSWLLGVSREIVYPKD